MYGNVLTNRQISRLQSDRLLQIRPFSVGALKEAAYTLNPGRILRMNPAGRWSVVHSLLEDEPVFKLAAHEYVIVEPSQSVMIGVDGIIGAFIQTSTNVEEGLLVVAGQIDSKYGTRGEALRFGVKNLFDRPNTISLKTRLVHLQLIDLRGSTSDPVTLTQQQEKVWDARRDKNHERDDSDGPLPPEA